MGNSTLIWPDVDVSVFWPLFASVNVMIEAEEMFGASR
jgi:hypothetical protein